MPKTTSDFCRSLAERFSALAPLLREHLRDNDELLPHIFLADVTRHVKKNGLEHSAIVTCLDNAFANEGPDVEDLIAVSFVEYLGSQDELAQVTDGITADHICEEWYRQADSKKR